MLIALVLGIAIPAGILFLREFFKYKIEGHEDVMKLTKQPDGGDLPWPTYQYSVYAERR